MKRLIFIMMLFTAASCGTKKQHVVLMPQTTKPADSCLTNKQYKLYLQFVKDSMKLDITKQNNELQLNNRRLKDSLNTVQKMFERQLKEATKQHRQDTRVNRRGVKEQGKTERTEAKQDGKTERNADKQETKQNKHDNQTARTETRQTEKTKRGCKWYVWLLVGFVLAKIPIKQFLKLMK